MSAFEIIIYLLIAAAIFAAIIYVMRRSPTATNAKGGRPIDDGQAPREEP